MLLSVLFVNKYQAMYDAFANASYFSSVADMYDLSFGGTGWWYVLIYFTLMAVIFFTTESPAGLAVFTVFGALIFKPYIPTALEPVFYTIAVLGLAMTMYKLFKPKQASKY